MINNGINIKTLAILTNGHSSLTENAPSCSDSHGHRNKFYAQLMGEDTSPEVCHRNLSESQVAPQDAKPTHLPDTAQIRSTSAMDPSSTHSSISYHDAPRQKQELDFYTSLMGDAGLGEDNVRSALTGSSYHPANSCQRASDTATQNQGIPDIPQSKNDLETTPTQVCTRAGENNKYPGPSRTQNTSGVITTNLATNIRTETDFSKNSFIHPFHGRGGGGGGGGGVVSVLHSAEELEASTGDVTSGDSGVEDGMTLVRNLSMILEENEDSSHDEPLLTERKPNPETKTTLTYQQSPRKTSSSKSSNPHAHHADVVSIDFEPAPGSSGGSPAKIITLTLPEGHDPKDVPSGLKVVPLFYLRKRMSRKQALQVAGLMLLGLICVLFILAWVFSPVILHL